MVGQRGVDVPEQGRGERDHDPGIDPVVQMADPADGQLREPRQASVTGSLLVEERGLGEVVARSGARVGVRARQLGIAVRREHGQDQREEQSSPHGRRRRLAP